jgi:hypothetical protein
MILNEGQEQVRLLQYEVLLAAENDKARHDLLLGGMRFIR